MRVIRASAARGVEEKERDAVKSAGRIVRNVVAANMLKSATRIDKD